MADPNVKKKSAILGVALALAGGYALYRMMKKKDTPIEAAKHVVEKPIDVAEGVVHAVAHPIKSAKHPIKAAKSLGDPEPHRSTKSRKSKKARAGHKGGVATKKLGKHKGHATERGLAQDQSGESKEEHEEHYRRDKRKGKR